jgi:hypothetical protein
LLTDEYEVELAEVLSENLDAWGEGDTGWKFKVKKIQFSLTTALLNVNGPIASESNEMALEPIAIISTPVLTWETMEEVPDSVIADIVRNQSWWIGFRIRELEDGGVALFHEYFTQLSMSVERDATFLISCINAMYKEAKAVQKKYL